MTSENTAKLSFRVRVEVYAAAAKKAEDLGLDLSSFLQDTVEKAVFDYLPASVQDRIEKERTLYAKAQQIARELDAAGRFDEHFNLTVFDAMMADGEVRALYEDLIGAGYAEDTPGKTPLNMYLGWFIKNAVPGAEPLLDGGNKPRRVFVKGQGKAIKSYTLLRKRPKA
jgi:hypothetical protein